MLNGKVVMITGASKGLGRALTLAFADEKAKLVICARTEAILSVVAKEAERLGAEVLAISADISKPRDVERFVSLTEKRFGKIDILINNSSKFSIIKLKYL